ncbi:unnamed protein product [Sphagnum troendelagicum]
MNHRTGIAGIAWGVLDTASKFVIVWGVLGTPGLLRRELSKSAVAAGRRILWRPPQRWRSGNVGTMAFPTIHLCSPPFKLIIFGDPGTTRGFLKSHLSAPSSAEFNKNLCHGTPGVEVHTLHFLNNSGHIQFDCWDTNPRARESRRSSGWILSLHIIGAHCAIIMLDLTVKSAFKYFSRCCRDLLKVCGDVPVVVCGINNMDLKNREVKSKQVTVSVNIGKKVKQIAVRRNRKVQYYEISAESNYNFEKPFRYLARELVGYILSQFEHHLSTFDT